MYQIRHSYIMISIMRGGSIPSDIVTLLLWKKHSTMENGAVHM